MGPSERFPHRRPRARTTSRPRTLVDEIWSRHLVAEDAEADTISVDRILLHDRQVGLVARSARHDELRAADRVVACADQQVSTVPSAGPPTGAQQAIAIERLERLTDQLGIAVFGPGDHRGGIVNVVAAEQGMVRPGDLVIGADDHVATLGALGALALRLADDEVHSAVATGEVRRARPGTMRVAVAGRAVPPSGKDLALWLLACLGPRSVAGLAIEMSGPVVRSLGVEGRSTLCNLMCETDATTVLIGPDAVVADYLEGRPFVPTGRSWADETAGWPSLASDRGADLHGDVTVVADAVGPWATWGTAIWQAAPIDGIVPFPDPRDARRAQLDERALADQGLEPGRPMSEIPVDHVFVGSCANARIEDLRAAAAVASGGRAQVRAWVVPGSWVVKRQAESEGLHRVFLDAGFEWRDPGCSLCIGANGDAVVPGTRLATTANRPYPGRVGPRSRAHVMSPASAAATALAGRLRPASARPGADG